MTSFINPSYYNTNINNDICINPDFNKIHMDPSLTNIKYDTNINKIYNDIFDKNYKMFDKNNKTCDQTLDDLSEILNRMAGEKLSRTKTNYVDKTTQTTNKENIPKDKNMNVDKVKEDLKSTDEIKDSFETTDPLIVELSEDESIANAENIRKRQEEMDYLPDDYNGIVIESRSNSIDEKLNTHIEKELTIEEMKNICVINGDDFDSPLMCDLTEEESIIKVKCMKRLREEIEYLPDDYEGLIINTKSTHCLPKEELTIKVTSTIKVKYLEKYREFMRQLAEDEL